MNIFFIFHLYLFVLAIIIPFIGNQKYLEFYSLLIPFLMFHWIMNNDTCVLTIIERWFIPSEQQTFSERLIGPIYNLSNEAIKVILFTLWIFVQYRTGHLKNLFTKT